MASRKSSSEESDPIPGRPLLRPELLLGDGVLSVPSDVVLVFDGSHVRGRGRRKPAPFRKVVERQGSAVVQPVGPGGPTCAVTVEFLAHLGARRIVIVGIAGSFDPSLRTGDVVVVDRAVSDEGTSTRYGGHLEPSEALSNLLAPLGPPATTLSTDAPLRLTSGDLDRQKSRAAVTDMEAAALFAACHELGLDAAAVLVVSDHFSSAGWKLGDRVRGHQAACESVSTVLDVLEGSA